ncbi:MAG: hypothetical protein DLM73_11700 [Chthoniobacterales bacterium]|nr:MAG: hypothetical protein DLM73_11700 [Chthoniobacterales bacterium]
MLAVLAFSQRVNAAPYGINLIVNGNAETGVGSANGNPVFVSGWTVSSAFTMIPYTPGTGYPGPGDPGPNDRGNNFFAGGNGAAVSTATQNINLSANAADINQGDVIFDLSGYFGGFSGDNDNARLSATFFNDTTSLGIATVGHVTAKDRGSATGLLLRRGSGIVPVDTTRVVITLTMTRISGASNDGYADSLQFICNLKAGSQTTAETFAGNGTGADATGPWSDSNRWVSAHVVPNNAGNNFFDVTILGVTVSGKLSNEDRTLTRRVGAAKLDISATVSNLTLLDAGLTDDDFASSGGANLLTVTGTTTDNSLQNQTGDNQTQTPGFTIQTRTGGADAILSLGHFTNFSGNTLSMTRFTLFSQGPAATVQFNGADIVNLGGTNTRISLIGSNCHVIDEVGNDALRHLAVIGTGTTLSVGALDFVTGGNLTINGGLGLADNGLDTSFTVTGALTNFDPATRTLSGGSISVQTFLSATANVIFRFNGADVVNNASSIGIISPTAKIVDQNGLDAFRNFAHNLAAGVVSFTDHNFSSTGAFTNDGSLSVNAQSLPTSFTINGPLTNLDSATKTLTGGVFRIFGSFSNASTTATLRFNGADIVHNAADLTVGGTGTIVDQSSNNGLRNFVDNTKAGTFSLLGQSFAAPTDFTNAGTLFISNFNSSQVFSVAGGHSYIQTGGETSLGDSILTAANVLIQGGIIHHGGTINGNVNVSRGTIAPTGGGGGGSVSLSGAGVIIVPGSYLIPGPDTMTINGNLNLAADAHLGFVIRNNTAGEFDTMTMSGSANFGGTLDVSLINGFTPAPGDSFTVLTAGPTITGAFINAPNGSRFPTADNRGSFIATYSDNHLVLSNFQSQPPDQLLNISTRMKVLGGDNVLIAGFIITGTDPKTVIIRGIGPWLSNFGIQGFLADPTLELHQGNTTLATNDNWKLRPDGSSQQAEIEATHLQPTFDVESALIATLTPGQYTAILAGKNGTGIGLVEVYDLAQGANSKLANISTRGFVDTNDNAMIGGFIVGGNGGGAAQVIVRALGPSLPLSGTLQNPTLELHDVNGATIATDDNWKDSQQQEIANSIPPTNDLESAIVRTLAPGNYTAVVRGADNGTGIALVEVYNLR